MYIHLSIAIIIVLVIKSSVNAIDVCKLCQCSDDLTLINCDKKGLQNLDNIDFPSNVKTLTLINNSLKFDTINDRTKIESLPKLTNLILNQNPLEIIPPFNIRTLQFLSLEDTSLTSAEFPISYNNSSLQRISLSNNKIHSINETDFLVLHNSQLTELSLKNNQLKSCEFLLNLPRLYSINLDKNQFTSLPEQLTTPGKIRNYSFMHNFITVIDETSPLNIWLKNNYTNMKIYLTNNSLDCCLSFWFIRFLKISFEIVGNASLLTCTSPLNFAGKLLIDLNPDEMNCHNDITKKPRVIGIISGFIGIIIISIVAAFIWNQRRPLRSGYREIDGIDESYGGPAFPISDEEIQ
ncbi:unnamed protein product [Adineta steineri]|uniref:Uncharacterized protein n=1 Tax=Adineta steineri TaxID=433720 RepID=A0A813PW59_9BILA|nr:unnamed protein product [Adineta steineri]CAF1484161.1 unnamed protein product [Adineta steineri]